MLSRVIHVYYLECQTVCTRPLPPGAHITALKCTAVFVYSQYCRRAVSTPTQYVNGYSHVFLIAGIISQCLRHVYTRQHCVKISTATLPRQDWDSKSKAKSLRQHCESQRNQTCCSSYFCTFQNIFGIATCSHPRRDFLNVARQCDVICAKKRPFCDVPFY